MLVCLFHKQFILVSVADMFGTTTFILFGLESNNIKSYKKVKAQKRSVIRGYNKDFFIGGIALRELTGFFSSSHR